jgi:tripartite-type tricarboxylate transporter receptor subunit TctC
MKEFVRYAKANPGKLNFATIGRGTLSYLGGEMLKSSAGFDMVPVMYNSTPAAQTDVLSGRVQVILDNITTAKRNIEAGKVRALGVTTKQRATLLPNVPTISESGFPEFDVKGWYGLVAPEGTPKEIVDKLHAATVKVVNTAAMKQRLQPLVAEGMATTPEQFRAYVNAGTAKWSKVVKAANIQPE